MRILPGSMVLSCVFLAGFAPNGFCQNSDLSSKVDAVIADAYQSASAKFPCKLKARGSAKMLRWQDVEKCLNGANDQVDWEDLAQRLQKIRESAGLQLTEISSVIESSLSKQALPYNKIFLVKDVEALLPLSNTLLKFLPADSLMDLPVYDKSGQRMGTFSGTYFFETIGEISGNKIRLPLFQYTDLKGNIHSSPDRLLYDSFGVPWKGAISQPGFRLPPDKLIPKR